MAQLSCHLVEVPSSTFSGEGYAVLCSGGMGLRDIQDLPAPKSWEGIGSSELDITTSSDSAQHWFNQGLNHLHGFSHLEAWRAFREVVRLDPECAMGYWGVGMCMPGFGGDDLSLWKKSIIRAGELSSNCTPVEKGLIEALKVTVLEGVIGAQPNWQRLATAFADEPEAVAFAAIMLRQTVQNEQESDSIKAILDKALKDFPDHVGLLHYYVHLMEVRPDFHLAEAAAERLQDVAPNNSHLVHMPGHLYFLDGAYQKAANVFEAARAQEQAYHLEQGIPPAIDQNHLHNLHFLTVTYTDLDQYEEALQIAEEYASLALRHDQRDNSAGLLLNYKGRVLPALVNMRFRKYAAAAQSLQFWLSAMNPPHDEALVINYLCAMQAYCLGMQALETHNEDAAIRASKSMKGYIDAFEEAAELETGIEQLKHVNQTYDIMMMHWYELVGWGVNMDASQAFIPDPWKKAYELEAAIGYAEPPRLLYPVGESQMRLHLKRNEQVAAQKALARALEKRPGSPLIQSTYSLFSNNR